MLNKGNAHMKKLISRLAAATLALPLMAGMASSDAHAGPDPFIGEVMLVGYNFCPRGWAEANGQLLPISQNTALFSLYGTMYGGDGRTTFALPDLRGRAPIHSGQAPGLPNKQQGQKGQLQSLSAGNPGDTGTLAMRWCVALTGVYPSRN